MANSLPPQTREERTDRVREHFTSAIHPLQVVILAMETGEKTAGKNSQPFQKDVQQIYPNEEPCLTALQTESLEVVVFRRAGAAAVAAANR